MQSIIKYKYSFHRIVQQKVTFGMHFSLMYIWYGKQLNFYDFKIFSLCYNISSCNLILCNKHKQFLCIKQNKFNFKNPSPNMYYKKSHNKSTKLLHFS